MSAATEIDYEVPAWLRGPIWAQACNRQGEVTEIPRERIDIGGRVVLHVPEGAEVFLSSARVYDAQEGGTMLDEVAFPVPRRVTGPMSVHCVLDAYSH